MSRETTQRRCPQPSIRRRALAGVSAMALAWSLALTVASPSIAAPGTRVNVEPEVLVVGAGQTVTLTALVAHPNGDPADGTESNTHVRWFFAAGSPNDVDNPGNSPDLQCWTGTAGECSVSYAAAVTGTDTICVLVGGPTSSCDEPHDATDWDDNVDVVLRVVTNDPSPTPTPTPTPTLDATPTPEPTATPTLDATPTPEPTATPTLDATPTPEPTATPTPEATPTPTPPPTPTPLPTPMPPSEPDAATPSAAPTAAAGIAEPQEPGPTEPPTEAAAPGPGVTPSEPGPSETGSGTPEHTAPRRGGGASSTDKATPIVAPAPAMASRAADTVGPVAVVGQVLSAAVGQVARVVQPAAAAAVATEFGFPLALAAAVLGFLLIQGYVDRRDPKLRMAPRTSLETIVQFKSEEQL